VFRCDVFQWHCAVSSSFFCCHYQQFYSEALDRRHSFSAFAYEVISFDLILEGWVNRPANLSDDEKWWLDVAPQLREQMQKCLAAAKADGNTEMFGLIDMVNEWFGLMDDSIRLRIREDRIPVQLTEM
jgi:hypothetical protein